MANYSYSSGKWVLNSVIDKRKVFRATFGKLPNNLIFDIIRIADGGKNTHKVKYSKVMAQIIHDHGRRLRPGWKAGSVWWWQAVPK